jgi:hypothetical protein
MKKQNKKISSRTGKPFKTWRDYTYSYPDHRELAKGLRLGDIKEIAEKTNYSIDLVYAVINGKRQNKEILDMIKKYVKLNKAFKQL